ncbi:MAG: hypothetical protein J6P83_01090 [Bacteroidales bacterium]|nr:hypothetical protein [Bacteroidales bacterium]
MKRQLYFLLTMLAMSLVSCDIIIKPDPNSVTTNVDSVVVNVKVVGDSLVIKAEVEPVDISQCDMVMLDKGKLFFYNSGKPAMVPFAAETDSVVNCVFTPDNHLYYCVPVEGRMMLRSIDLNEAEPQPKQVGDWGVDYEKCVTETYGTVSPLTYYPLRNMLGLWHEFSWDSYSLTQQKLYNLSNGNITDWKWEDMGTDVEEDEFTYLFEVENGQYWFQDGIARVCLSDKIDFNPYVSDPDYASERDYSLISWSPDKSKVLYAAILEWGDLPHGILAVASLDGETQLPLEDTDCTGFVADWLKDGSLVYVGEEPLSPSDPDYDANWHYRAHCIKRVFPDGNTEIIAHCGDFQVK